jgi:hypothetical protein
MSGADNRKAYAAIEDDLNLLHSAAGVLYLACGYLEDRREGESAVPSQDWWESEVALSPA